MPVTTQAISACFSRYDLPPSLAYLLPLMPLIATMWADGRNQLQERAIVENRVRQYREILRQTAGGIEVITSEDLAVFGRRFLDVNPDRTMLDELCQLAFDQIQARGLGHQSEPSELVKDCLEIAAACTVSLNQSREGGREGPERFTPAEHDMIERLFSELGRLQ